MGAGTGRGLRLASARTGHALPRPLRRRKGASGAGKRRNRPQLLRGGVRGRLVSGGPGGPPARSPPPPLSPRGRWALALLRDLLGAPTVARSKCHPSVPSSASPSVAPVAHLSLPYLLLVGLPPPPPSCAPSQSHTHPPLGVSYPPLLSPTISPRSHHRHALSVSVPSQSLPTLSCPQSLIVSSLCPAAVVPSVSSQSPSPTRPSQSHHRCPLSISPSQHPLLRFPPQCPLFFQALRAEAQQGPTLLTQSWGAAMPARALPLLQSTSSGCDAQPWPRDDAEAMGCLYPPQSLPAQVSLSVPPCLHLFSASSCFPAETYAAASAHPCTLRGVGVAWLMGFSHCFLHIHGVGFPLLLDPHVEPHMRSKLR